MGDRETTEFSYDNQGRLAQFVLLEQAADSALEFDVRDELSVTYNSAGFSEEIRSQSFTPDGVFTDDITRFIRDDNGRLIQQQLIDATSNLVLETQTVTYSADGLPNTLTIEFNDEGPLRFQPDSTIRFTFDPLPCVLSYTIRPQVLAVLGSTGALSNQTIESPAALCGYPFDR